MKQERALIVPKIHCYKNIRPDCFFLQLKSGSSLFVINQRDKDLFKKKKSDSELFVKKDSKVSVAEPGQAEDQIFRRQLLFMFFFSIIIHLVLSIFLVTQSAVFLPQPLDLKDNEVEKRIEFELVDVPDDAVPLDPKVKTNFISDRSARASDMKVKEKVPLGEAMSLGDYDINEYKTGITSDGPDSQAPRANDEPVEPADQDQDVEPPDNDETQLAQLKNNFLDSAFSSQYFPKRNQVKPPPQPHKPYRKQTRTRAPNTGGFALNTYAWNWAPYLKEMKKKIEEHLFLPVAFRQYGMIGGQTVVRFRVTRDGQVQSVVVLESSGHESLKQCSVHSITAAQPFKPLPDDFPEDMEYLEITAHYHFLNRK
ncbi:energy transducer TonB [candidate division CSSED10-310 bacterium]|uniref:Energy transducer TonB n=1 Tax=candidate division CSSED10-310 bacterium TaxID=2855610 RepID=A0ABV6YR77_UNCC1